MVVQISKWKRWRAVAANKLAPEPGTDMENIRSLASSLESRGLKWFTVGFDDWTPEAIQHLLRKHGIDTDTQWFVSNAKHFPGPTEIAEHWSVNLRVPKVDAEYLVYLPHLAARALWNKLLPDTPSIETTADDIERRIFASQRPKRETSTEDTLTTLRVVSAATEGSKGVRQALDAELPVPLASWIANVLGELQEMSEPESWQQALDIFAETTNSGGYLQAMLGAAMVRTGHPQHAMIAVNHATSGENAEPTLLNMCAECANSAGFHEDALKLVKEALIRGDYDQKEEDTSKQILHRVLENLGMSELFDRHIQDVQLIKREQLIATRKKRRKQEKKHGRR